jgi:hypothetical protein
MKIPVQLLLASQLCLWNVAFAQEPFHSIVVGGLHSDAPTIRTVDIGNGITLHYVDQGKGTPVIFVHGSLSDGSQTPGTCARSCFGRAARHLSFGALAR